MSERRVVNCGSKTNKSGANGTSGNGKKLVIKPLKLRPTLPEAFEEETWCRLQAAVKAVQQQLPVACSFEELYRAVEDMCTHKLSAQTYTRLRECCDERVGSEVARLRSDLSLDTLQFLQRVNATWRRHCEQMMLIRSIFLYLDRSYVYPTVELGVRSIYDLGLRLFCQHLQQHGDVQQKIVEDLLLLVERERRGDAVDRSLLKSLIDMFSSLGIYSAIFQQPFLDQTGVFYTKEGESKMGSMDVAEYLLHCETRLQQEADRCITYLNESTKQQLILTVEKHLVTRHIETLLERGYTPLVEDMRVEDLARLYRLSFRINHLMHLRVHFKEMIKTFGRRIVMDQAKDAEMVESLLAFKERMDRIVTESFGQDQEFFNVMREAFENFINQRENKPAELIAKFLDAKLKQGSKGQTEDELELDLDRVLTLFRFIQGKDVFEAFYKKDLAKRLLLNRSASIDAEKSMITKLRSECGSQFTTKLEGMFKDIELSRELMNTFRTSTIARQQLPPGLELYVNVLTSGFWPTYPMIDVAMPEELAQYQSTFRDFYLSKHGGRHLVWQNSLGQCILKARFDAGPKELIVSLFQAVVLLLFNEEEEMSFEAIKQASKIEDRELRRTLQSLACGKVRVLLKEPKGREVGDDDLFRFYGGLKELRFRIKINTIQLKETPEENKKTNDQIMQDRQYQIDAAIVRIMKMRKMLSHKLLIQELVSQLKFSVRASDLKKRIESLIEREYLERSASEKDVYHYLA